MQTTTRQANGYHHHQKLPASTLTRLIGNDTLSFLMEAHDGLSAAIAREAGFQGLWASGLAIASTLGYRDCNEASWTSVTDAVERIVDCSGLPVLVDGDTGFEIDQASADPVDLGYRP